jgi:hypothetical protein
MGVFFLVISLFFVITAYVIVKVIVVVAAAVKKRNYKRAVTSGIALLLFILFLYLAYVSMYDYTAKVMSEGLH